ncbi:hypothetical protein LJB85_02700, partial [Porphyromonadaceae bacterium OttesenSCG-928-L07]|nr:hypothetical protein [Porphyromonadaceae bacterium OttesenSCG-928-L07]
GMGYSDAALYLAHGDWETRFYDEHETGYILLNKFYPVNTVLIRQLSAFIKEVQKKGYKNVIIDIRENSGGSGNNFDNLISLFTDKSSIPYLKEKYIRVSKYTQDSYKFLRAVEQGELFRFEKKDFYSEFPTNPKKYQGEMNYYILISRNTGSVAASFANIIQYNNLGKLVGEPLKHNALYYGEVLPMGWKSRSNVETISTVYMNEYTRSPDGQVYPDISIPFVAEEFLEGDDPLVGKLLELIKVQLN